MSELERITSELAYQLDKSEPHEAKCPSCRWACRSDAMACHRCLLFQLRILVGQNLAHMYYAAVERAAKAMNAMRKQLKEEPEK